MDIIVIGVDPGEVTGIARLRVTNSTFRRPTIISGDFCQVTSGLVNPVLDGMRIFTRFDRNAFMVVATERFVVGPRAARSSTAKAGTLTRDIVTLVRTWADLNQVAFVERSAADVKPWATDERLDRAGLLDKAQKMRHAKDAGRHALFEAVRNHHVADPLSTRAGVR